MGQLDGKKGVEQAELTQPHNLRGQCLTRS